MSVSKINFNGSNEAYIVVEPISDIDKEDFKTYLDLDSPSFFVFISISVRREIIPV